MSISTLIDKKELKIAQEFINRYPIPSPPILLTNLNAELVKTTPDANLILNWISEDIGLSAQVIKTINSPLYGLQTEIESLEHAVSLLGINTLKNIIIKPAYQYALIQSFKGYESVSEVSHQIASLAELIAREIETNIPSGYFYLTGLFHNVGSLILGAIHSDYMEYSDENTLNPITWPLLEIERYHVRHTAIGVLSAKHWGLSNTICNAIYLHHSIIPTYKKVLDNDSITMSAVLQLSSYLSNKLFLQLPTEESFECNVIYKTAIDELMISEDTISSISQDAGTIL